MSRKGKARIPDGISILPLEFHAEKEYVVAVFDLASIVRQHNGRVPDTIGLRFVSPDHLLGFLKEAIDTAAKVWPNDPYIKMYLEEEK